MGYLTEEQVARAIDLYRIMPGAPMPPIHDGEWAWGEVDNTEHWAFCERVVRMIDAAVRAQQTKDR